MNRRHFISTLVGGIATQAAVRTWPFRVFSFPSNVFILSQTMNTSDDESIQWMDGTDEFLADLAAAGGWEALIIPAQIGHISANSYSIQPHLRA